MNTRSVVKVQWQKIQEGWKASLLTSGPDKFRSFPLETGNPINLEISSERRCTGFSNAPGKRTVCPRFAEIENGSQCQRCRNRDIYTGYVEGRGSDDVEGLFDVYLAQCGSAVKVGVTRNGRITKRWVEQGADYGAILLEGVTQEEALEKEQALSDKGLSERIRKKQKTSTPEKHTLREVADRYNETVQNIVDVQELTVYPQFPDNPFNRDGRFVGEIVSVKGQIIAIEAQCMAMTSGKTVTEPSQKGLDDYTS